MAAVSLTISLFFLLGAIVLYWLSRVIHAELLDDAILSLGFSLAALGISQVAKYGLAQGVQVISLLLALG